MPASIRGPVLVERAEAQGGAQSQDVERPLRHEQPTGAVEVVVPADGKQTVFASGG